MPEQDFAAREGAAVVTGGSGAVGSAVCRLLAQRGSNVALSYHSRVQAAQSAIDTAPPLQGKRLTALQADLSDPASAHAFAAQVLDQFGAVHTLIHAAGPHVTQKHLGTVDPEQFSRHLNEEAAGFFNIVHALLPALRSQRGSIVAVTTVATVRFPVKDGLSSGPKGAVEALVRAFAAEEGRYGVRANSVGPGILSDGMAERLVAGGEVDARDLEAAGARIPLRRLGGAEEVAQAVCFLASPRAAYITGQKLDVDGGYSL